MKVGQSLADFYLIPDFARLSEKFHRLFVHALPASRKILTALAP